MLEGLPIVLSQVNAGNISENFVWNQAKNIFFVSSKMNY